MINRLFVYGTLAPGRPNEHVLANVTGHWEPAVVKGTLFDEGWGAMAGYPGIVPDENGEEVNGFVFTSLELQDHLVRLDEFEGSGYERTIVPAQLRDGSVVTAYVYRLSDHQDEGSS
jgi:gamma-glutamylcyclotransferase (GGCT)/AIG2-like uncharacterized protein YtfP